MTSVTPSIPHDWVARLLAFWFEAHDQRDWFGGGPAFDAEIRRQFADWWEALRSRAPDEFVGDASTSLAAIILFDQVPRNIHRHHADAFATDPLALAIARQAIERGLDRGLATERRLFFYLPFEHSESLEDQRESLRLMDSLGNAAYLEYARKHFAVIERFGRFPHRNAALGRPDRPGEAEAIAEGLKW